MVFIDHPAQFCPQVLSNPLVTKHTTKGHRLWMPKENVVTYEFEKEERLNVDPFAQEKIQKPYLTFCFALQIVLRQKPQKLYLYGCDFLQDGKQAYCYQSGEVPEHVLKNKKKAMDVAVDAFVRWQPYMAPTQVISLSPISRLNSHIPYEPIKELEPICQK